MSKQKKERKKKLSFSYLEEVTFITNAACFIVCLQEERCTRALKGRCGEEASWLQESQVIDVCHSTETYLVITYCVPGTALIVKLKNC